MTDDSCIEVGDLDDFDTSDLDSQEILNKYFSSSACAISENLLDGKNLIKFLKIDMKASDRTIDAETKRCVRSEDPSVSSD